MGRARREELEPERSRSRAHGERQAAVPVVHLIQPLLAHHLERLLQRQHQAHRRRERRLAQRGALARPPEVPVEARQLVPFDGARRPRGEAQRADSGRDHEALLRAAHHHVDAPSVLGQGMDADAGDAVHHQTHVARPGDPGDGLEVVHRPGRGLAVGREHRLDRAILVERPLHRRGIDRGPPLERDHLVRDAVGLENRGPAVAELSGARDQGLGARGHEIHHRRLHRPGAGGGEQEHLAVGAVEPAQLVDHAPQRVAKDVGAVVGRNLGQGAKDALRDLDRAGGEEADLHSQLLECGPRGDGSRTPLPRASNARTGSLAPRRDAAPGPPGPGPAARARTAAPRPCSPPAGRPDPRARPRGSRRGPSGWRAGSAPS